MKRYLLNHLGELKLGKLGIVSMQRLSLIFSGLNANKSNRWKLFLKTGIIIVVTDHIIKVGIGSAKDVSVFNLFTMKKQIAF